MVNGTEGIGTGFSSYIPPFNPLDIKHNIERVINGETVVPMKPWFDKFTGRVFSNEGGLWITEGVWKSSGKNVLVTELPPGRWTQDYKEYLDTLIEKKKIMNYVNNSTTCLLYTSPSPRD